MLMVIIMLGRVGYARFYAGRFGAGQLQTQAALQVGVLEKFFQESL